MGLWVPDDSHVMHRALPDGCWTIDVQSLCDKMFNQLQYAIIIDRDEWTQYKWSDKKWQCSQYLEGCTGAGFKTLESSSLEGEYNPKLMICRVLNVLYL